MRLEFSEIRRALQEASDYSRAGTTRLELNAFNAIWLPDSEKDAYVAALKKYAVANGVAWCNVTLN